jgi:heat shock protein HtpX
MDPRALATHRWNNRLHAALLLGGMALLLGALGYTLGGFTGAAMALAAGAVLTGLTPRISPQWVLGLYQARRLQPRDAPGLFQAAAALTAAAGLERLPALFYVPSAMMNAFSVGTREDPAIALTDGLLRGLSSRELLGVLAHEVSHIRNNDMWIMSMADGVSRMVSLFSLFGQVLFAINLPLFLLGLERLPWPPILLLLAAPTASALLQLALSRNREYDADLDAANLTGDPEGLALALQRLERAQGRLWEQVLFPGARLPDPALLRSHPPTEERVRRLLSLTPAPRLEPFGTGSMEPWWEWPVVLRRPRRGWLGTWH